MSIKNVPQGVVGLRRQGSRKYPVLTLTVPSKMARALFAAGQEHGLFSCEFTEDGILFRRVADVVRDDAIELPAWAKNGSAS